MPFRCSRLFSPVPSPSMLSSCGQPLHPMQDLHKLLVYGRYLPQQEMLRSGNFCRIPSSSSVVFSYFLEDNTNFVVLSVAEDQAASFQELVSFLWSHHLFFSCERVCLRGILLSGDRERCFWHGKHTVTQSVSTKNDNWSRPACLDSRPSHQSIWMSDWTNNPRWNTNSFQLGGMRTWPSISGWIISPPVCPWMGSNVSKLWQESWQYWNLVLLLPFQMKLIQSISVSGIASSITLRNLNLSFGYLNFECIAPSVSLSRGFSCRKSLLTKFRDLGFTLVPITEFFGGQVLANSFVKKNAVIWPFTLGMLLIMILHVFLSNFFKKIFWFSVS